MPPVRTFFLWLHLTAVVVWVGGMVAVSFIAAPVLRREAQGRGEEAVRALVLRFQRLSRELILVILLTGIFNVLSVGMPTSFSYSPGFIRTVGAKVVLFSVMVGNQAWYSHALVPGGRSRQAAWSAAINLLLASVVLYLGVTLR